MSANYVTIPGGTNYNLVITAENYSMQNGEFRFICKTATGPITIQLPPISAFKNALNINIIVDDADDNSSANPITVLADPSNTINNSPSAVLSNNGDKAYFYVASETEFSILATSNVLGANGIVYVDTFIDLPVTPSPLFLYITKDNNKLYRKNGAGYLELKGVLDTLFQNRLLLTSIFITDTVEDLVYSLPNLAKLQLAQVTNVRSVLVPLVTTIQQVQCSSNQILETIDFPLLQTVVTPPTFGTISINVAGNPLTTMANFPALTSASGSVFFATMSSMNSLLLPLLATCGEDIFLNSNGFVSISFPSLVSSGSFSSYFNLLATSLNIPLLASLTKTNTGFRIQSCFALPTFSAPSLVSVASVVYIENNNVLTSFSFPALTTINGLFIFGNPILPIFNFPSLTTNTGDLTISNNNLLTDANLPLLQNSKDFSITNNALLTSINLNQLSSIVGAIFSLSFNNSLINFSLPSLTTANNTSSSFTIDQNPLLSTFSLPLLTSVNYSITFNTNPNLTSVDLGSLTTVGAFNSITIGGSPLLTTVNISSFIGTDQSIYFNGCALNLATVDSILASLDANGGTNGTVDMSGGTSASPTGGLLNPNLVSLQGKGWGVGVN